MYKYCNPSIFLIDMMLSSRNSQFRDEYSLEQITNAPVIYEPLTKLQCCPTSDGSAAAILASEQFVIDNGLQEKVNGVHLYKFIVLINKKLYN